MNDTRLSVVHVLSSLQTGGTELNTVRLANALAERGIRQVVVSLATEFNEEVITQIAVPFHRPRRPIGFSGAVRFLGRVLRDQQAGVLHGRGFVTWRECTAAKLLTRGATRLIQSIHGPGTFRSRRWSRSVTAVLLRDLTDAFVAVSDHLAGCLMTQWNVTPRCVQIIPNGIDTERFGPCDDPVAAKQALHLDPRRFVVGTVGSLCRVKNHAFLLQAFAQLHATRRNSQLLIVGAGPLHEELICQARQLGIEAAVRFCGRQPDVPGFLRAMDVFVQPSTSEGSPTAVLEAMSCRVAAVGTPSPGCTELQKKCGLPLIVTAGRGGQLCAVLRKLHDNPTWRHQIGCLGREIIQRSYPLDNMVDAYECLYRAIARREVPRSRPKMEGLRA